jgi:ankyrin repeat protein
MDSGGNTLVCLAALHGDHKMIKVLIENGFDPNIPNNQGDTPLHHAITG